MTTLIEAFSAVLLSLGSVLILRTLWRIDVPPKRAVPTRRPSEAPEYKKAA